MSAKLTLLTSLTEPISYVNESFREIAGLALQKGRSGGFCVDPLHYDSTEFVAECVKEIFDGPPSLHQLGELLPSTKILIRDGLTEVQATSIALEAFKLVTDHIALFVPEAQFRQTDDILVDVTDRQELNITALNLYNDE